MKFTIAFLAITVAVVSATAKSKPKPQLVVGGHELYNSGYNKDRGPVAALHSRNNGYASQYGHNHHGYGVTSHHGNNFGLLGGLGNRGILGAPGYSNHGLRGAPGYNNHGLLSGQGLLSGHGQLGGYGGHGHLGGIGGHGHLGGIGGHGHLGGIGRHGYLGGIGSHGLLGGYAGNQFALGPQAGFGIGQSGYGLNQHAGLGVNHGLNQFGLHQHSHGLNQLGYQSGFGLNQLGANRHGLGLNHGLVHQGLGNRGHFSAYQIPQYNSGSSVSSVTHGYQARPTSIHSRKYLIEDDDDDRHGIKTHGIHTSRHGGLSRSRVHQSVHKSGPSVHQHKSVAYKKNNPHTRGYEHKEHKIFSTK